MNTTNYILATITFSSIVLYAWSLYKEGVDGISQLKTMKTKTKQTTDMEHKVLETGSNDCRKDWFMQQHFSPEELQQIYDWEQESGKIAKVINDAEIGFAAHHILDVENKIDLCRMKEEYMLRRWVERLGYKTKDGKTAKQFEEENGIKDEPRIEGKEIFRTQLPNDKTSIMQYG